MAQDSQPHDGRKDFDFLIGNWNVHNRVLSKRLADETTWQEYEATAVARHVLNGLGNVDEITFDHPAGTRHGMTVRVFNPKTQQWSLYWADNSGILYQPMLGEFKDERGVFYDHELHEGKGIFCRYIWSDITPNSCRWQQAYSNDGGATWETNWIMEFTRQESV